MGGGFGCVVKPNYQNLEQFIEEVGLVTYYIVAVGVCGWLVMTRVGIKSL